MHYLKLSMALGTTVVAQLASATAFDGFATGTTSIGNLLDQGEMTSPQFNFTKKVEDDHGGDGGATALMNFASGVVGVSSHGCVNPDLFAPPVTFRSDTGKGNAFSKVTSEILTIESSTLAVGTPVTIRVCLNVAVEMMGFKAEPSHVTNSATSTTFGFNVRDQNLTSVALASGNLGISNNLTTVVGTGVFDGVTANDANYFQTYEFTRNVGEKLFFTLNVTSASQATAIADIVNGDAVRGFSSASSGIAATSGLDAITEGAYLRSASLGTIWTGHCGDAVTFIPPNPVHPTPEPGSLAAVGLGLACVAKRVRQKRRVAA